MREFTEQELVRREKAEKLRELGLDPFGKKFERTALANDIKEKYKDIEKKGGFCKVQIADLLYKFKSFVNKEIFYQ